MRVTFIGTGYVGLVSGTLLSSLGIEVICCDNNQQKISDLQNFKLPIYEPGLDEYIKKATQEGNLQFKHTFEIFKSKNDEYISADAVFIAVGTPPHESGEADLSYIYEALLQVAESYDDKTLIVIKSTVPPGTCQALEALLRLKGFAHNVAGNPEFLREGSAIDDFLNPDRIVIGTSSEVAANTLKLIYKPFIDKGFNFLSTDHVTSELIKYSSNAFLATKIGFINEMANLCEKVGANVDMLSTGMGLDSRIGKSFLKAGPGFGGSCFPKDLLALSHLAKTNEQPCHILDAVILSNQNRSSHMVRKISEAIGDLRDKIICVLGITFKAGTDDVRSSPAIIIVKLLIEKGARIKIYDPEGMENGSFEISEAKFANNPYEAAKDADAIVILTEWEEFKLINFEKMHEVLAQLNIFDFRNILDKKNLTDLGYNYYKVG